MSLNGNEEVVFVHCYVLDRDFVGGEGIIRYRRCNDRGSIGRGSIDGSSAVVEVVVIDDIGITVLAEKVGIECVCVSGFVGDSR